MNTTNKAEISRLEKIADERDPTDDECALYEKLVTGEGKAPRKLYFDSLKHAKSWAKDFKALHGKIWEVGVDYKGPFATWELMDNPIRKV